MGKYLNSSNRHKHQEQKNSSVEKLTSRIHHKPIITMLRQSIIRQARLFSTAPRLYKGPVETAKDTLKQVDRTISDAAVSGIEKGEQAAANLKGSLPSTGEVKGKAQELSGQAQGKASELSGQAKGAANEAQGADLSSKASELAGQAKGKAHELAGEAKGKAAEVQGEVKKNM